MIAARVVVWITIVTGVTISIAQAQVFGPASDQTTGISDTVGIAGSTSAPQTQCGGWFEVCASIVGWVWVGRKVQEAHDTARKIVEADGLRVKLPHRQGSKPTIFRGGKLLLWSHNF